MKKNKKNINISNHKKQKNNNQDQKDRGRTLISEQVTSDNTFFPPEMGTF